MKKTKGKKSGRIFILVSALCLALLIGCVPITSDGNKQSGAERMGLQERKRYLRRKRELHSRKLKLPER